MKRVFIFLAATSGLMFGLGYLGALHPFFDAIAIGRRVALFGCIIFLVLLVRNAVLCVVLLGVLALTATILRPPSADQPGDVRVYTKNLWHANQQIDAVVSDIRRVNPDVVFLQEVSENNRAIISELQADLPYQARCPWQGWNGIAILSRWPFPDAEPRCSPDRSLMAMRVDRPAGSFWAVGVHLQQPWPDVQWQHLTEGLSVLHDLDGGAIVAGDFNTVPWSAAALEIGARTRTRLIGPPRATFRLFGVPLPLDQIWAQIGRVELAPALGSDHLGVFADVQPSAAHDQ